MDSARRVGLRIRAIRKRRGLTQAELGKRIGRSVNAMSALECGRNKLTFDNLLGLASALNVPVGEFFAPAGPADDAGGCPKHAALFREILDDARTLPLPELEMTVEIVGVVARRHGG